MLARAIIRLFLAYIDAMNLRLNFHSGAIIGSFSISWCGHLLAHHAISLALHVTSLIVLKGSLDGCGSKLMPDKLHLGFGYACDGPGRGGTCDLSAWDTNNSSYVIHYHSFAILLQRCILLGHRA